MFRRDAAAAKFKPADGQHVDRARPRSSVYEAEGEYQIVCEHLEPRGLGALQLAFEQLKRGSRPRACSTRRASVRCRCCRARIGIVTSLDGAAVRDIVRVVADRYAGAAPR